MEWDFNRQKCKSARQQSLREQKQGGEVGMSKPSRLV